MEFGSPERADGAAALYRHGVFNGGSSGVGDVEEGRGRPDVLHSHGGSNGGLAAPDLLAGSLQSSAASSMLNTHHRHQQGSSDSRGGNWSPSAASDPAAAMTATFERQYMNRPSAAYASGGGGDVSVQLPRIHEVVVVQPIAPLMQKLQQPRRGERLRGLWESVPHYTKMKQLKRLEKQIQKEGSWHKKGVRRLSKELFVIVSWYALLQSGIFAAVASTTVFSCEDWWGVVVVVAMVAAGTVMAAIDKLYNMGDHQREIMRFQARHSAVYDAIDILRIHGSTCDLNSIEPSHNFNFDAELPGNLVLACSPYRLLILLFLLGFSVLITICSLAMLCHSDCKCL